jgi:hypothetical protein
VELNRKIRILDIVALLVIISALISSILTIYLGEKISGNMPFSITALAHGGAVLGLLWKRNQLFDKTW